MGAGETGIRSIGDAPDDGGQKNSELVPLQARLCGGLMLEPIPDAGHPRSSDYFVVGKRDVLYGDITRETKRTLVAGSIALHVRKRVEQREQRQNQSR